MALICRRRVFNSGAVVQFADGDIVEMKVVGFFLKMSRQADIQRSEIQFIFMCILRPWDVLFEDTIPAIPIKRLHHVSTISWQTKTINIFPLSVC